MRSYKSALLFLSLTSVSWSSMAWAQQSYEDYSKLTKDSAMGLCVTMAEQAQQTLAKLYFAIAKNEFDKVVAKATSKDLADYPEYLKLTAESRELEYKIQQLMKDQQKLVAEKPEGWVQSLSELDAREKAVKAEKTALAPRVEAKAGLLKKIESAKPAIKNTELIFGIKVEPTEIYIGNKSVPRIGLSFTISPSLVKAFSEYGPEFTGGQLVLDPAQPEKYSMALTLSSGGRGYYPTPLPSAIEEFLPRFCAYQKGLKLKSDFSDLPSVFSTANAVALASQLADNLGVLQDNPSSDRKVSKNRAVDRSTESGEPAVPSPNLNKNSAAY